MRPAAGHDWCAISGTLGSSATATFGRDALKLRGFVPVWLDLPSLSFALSDGGCLVITNP